MEAVDLLVAAAAAEHADGVLHDDHDFDVIAGHTTLDFASVWIAPRGSVD